MSNTYPDLRYSNFPDKLDNQMPIRDPSASDMVLINKYNSLIASGQYAAAIEFMAANETLQEAQMNADKLLRIHHSILALERYFFDNVQQRIFKIGNQRGRWNAYMSSFSTNEEYLLNQFDIVSYPIDGVEQYFMAISSSIEAGTLPTNKDYYMQLTIRGEIGASGIGMSPRGAWVNNNEYYQYDVVSHNGYLWYCTDGNRGLEPTDDSDIWKKINISMQSVISKNSPTNLADGGIWMHLQDDSHIILKTKDENGGYVPLYPETKASYVVDNTGSTLQDKLYSHYFERDDVKVTYLNEDPVFKRIATLIGTDVVVAEEILTETVDEDKIVSIKEFVCYDNTGKTVMYQTKKIYNHYNDGACEITTVVEE